MSELVGFGATPDEARAYVSRRVRAYAGLYAVIWSVLFLGSNGARVLLDANLLRNAGERYVIGIQVGCTAALTVTYWALGRWKVSLRGLGLVDAAITTAQTVSLAVLLLWGEPRLRTELVVTLGLTHVLVGRAALVPSTIARTVELGIPGALGTIGITYWLYTTREVPEGLPGALAVAAFVAVWCGLAILASIVVTRVIYGLERRAKENSQLGQYTLERCIGEGGMGIVYLARHALLRRATAVKLLPADRAGKGALKRFEREVQLTSQIAHPNVIAVYDYGRTPDGVFYYAMEYLEGIDLERLVADHGPLPVARVRHILRQVADALAEAHSVGLIHRDVKPANIVIVSSKRRHDLVKVLDFGLVKQVRKGGAAQSTVSTLVGTPLYVSPESIQSPEKVGARSDLYALGAVAYKLLTGQNSVKGKTLVEVCSAHLYERPERPSKRLGAPIPESLERLVMDCLEKDPDKRPASADEVVERLDAMTDIPRWTRAEAKDEGAGPVSRVMDEPAPESRAMAVDLVNR